MASARNWKKSPKRSVASIRAAWRRRGIFLHGTFMRERLESATFCAECVPKEVLRETGESWVETWVEGSHGWTSVPVCQGCKRSFSVFVDGDEVLAPELRFDDLLTTEPLTCACASAERIRYLSDPVDIELAVGYCPGPYHGECAFSWTRCTASLHPALEACSPRNVPR